LVAFERVAQLRAGYLLYIYYSPENAQRGNSERDTSVYIFFSRENTTVIRAIGILPNAEISPAQ